MTNSADPDRLTSSEANRSGSALFAKTGHVMFSKRRVKNQKIIAMGKTCSISHNLGYIFIVSHLAICELPVINAIHDITNAIF